MSLAESAQDLNIPVDVLLDLKEKLAIHTLTVDDVEIWPEGARLRIRSYLEEIRVKARIEEANQARRKANLEAHPNYRFLYSNENPYTKGQKPTQTVGSIDHNVPIT